MSYRTVKGGVDKMKRVYTLDRCRALNKSKGRIPLTPYEYKILLELAVDCPLAGMPFDQVSYLYPLQIPLSPQVRILSNDDEIFSVSLRQNFSKFVGIIGNLELKSAVTEHPGAILFAVGNIIKKIKGENTYYNLRPRGWLVVVDPEYFKRIGTKKTSRKKPLRKVG